MTITATSPAGTLAAVDALLGFRPHQAVALVFLHGSRVQVTAHVKLTDLGEESMPDHLARAARQTGADALLVVAYQPSATDLDTVQAVADHLSAQGVRTQEFIVVNESSYFSVMGRGSGSIDEVLTDPVSAQRVYEGQPVARSREEVAAQLQPGSDPEPDGYAASHAETLAAVAGMSGDAVAHALGEALDGLVRADQADGALLGRIAALCTHDAAQMPVLSRIRTHSAGHWLALWSRVVRIEGEGADLAMAAAGCAAWASGSGLLVNVACDHLDETAGEPYLVRMLRQAISDCMPPGLWDHFTTRLEADAA